MTDKLPEETAAESHVEGVGGVQFAEEVDLPMTDTPELKPLPCPICGKGASTSRVYHNPKADNPKERELWKIVHNANWGCPVNFDRGFASESSAIEAWNSRPAPETAKDVEGLIERMKRMRSKCSDNDCDVCRAFTDAITALQSQASERNVDVGFAGTEQQAIERSAKILREETRFPSGQPRMSMEKAIDVMSRVMPKSQASADQIIAELESVLKAAKRTLPDKFLCDKELIMRTDRVLARAKAWREAG